MFYEDVRDKRLLIGNFETFGISPYFLNNYGDSFVTMILFFIIGFVYDLVTYSFIKAHVRAYIPDAPE